MLELVAELLELCQLLALDLRLALLTHELVERSLHGRRVALGRRLPAFLLRLAQPDRPCYTILILRLVHIKLGLLVCLLPAATRKHERVYILHEPI